MRQLEAAELATWLSSAVTIARAMERDAKAEARPDASTGAPPASRGMFGTLDAE